MKKSWSDQGGSAFPRPPNGVSGMSLRDYFAGQALIGMISAAAKNAEVVEFPDLAKGSYMVADAMLKEREK